MCCGEENRAFSFDEFVGLLQRPPHEPCESELEFLTQAEYDRTFDEVMARYSRPVRHYIAHLVQDIGIESREVAADLTQKLFMSLYCARSSFDPPYIYRAARNAAYSELRRRGREIRALRRYWRGIGLDTSKPKEVDAPDPQPLPDQALIEQRREAAISSAVERLPEKFRTPLLLRVQGKSYQQIMRITEVNEGTVKSRICRGKRLLRRKLHAYL